jgi:hypothetical protein
MAAINVTPAGNQLYEVDIRDQQGGSQHEISVPDALLDRMDTDGIAVQDIVRAAVEFLTTRQSREDLDVDIDLSAMADRYEEFVVQVPARARELATDQGPPTGIHTADRDEPTGDERLVAEVRAEQADGQATDPRDTY